MYRSFESNGNVIEVDNEFLIRGSVLVCEGLLAQTKFVDKGALVWVAQTSEEDGEGEGLGRETVAEWNWNSRNRITMLRSFVATAE